MKLNMTTQFKTIIKPGETPLVMDYNNNYCKSV